MYSQSPTRKISVQGYIYSPYKQGGMHGRCVDLKLQSSHLSSDSSGKADNLQAPYESKSMVRG